MTAQKRHLGQFYTLANPFNHRAFRAWARHADLPGKTVLEPFAGCGSLIGHLQTMKLCGEYAAFDIQPAAATVGSVSVRRRNTFTRFPRGFDVCITNPPWLARNSAARRGLAFPDTPYGDLYQYALRRCLDYCGHVAALVPESFIRAGLFRERLHSFISLTTPIFADTTHPVGLAMFVPHATRHTTVYSGRKRIGRLADIENSRPRVDPGRKIVFNAGDGNLGLIAVDSSIKASIRFCDVRELADYEVGATCRYITRLSVAGKVNIARLNARLARFRDDTCDVLMTPYRGLRKDGQYRRRLDWALARGVICGV